MIKSWSSAFIRDCKNLAASLTETGNVSQGLLSSDLPWDQAFSGDQEFAAEIRGNLNLLAVNIENGNVSAFADALTAYQDDQKFDNWLKVYFLAKKQIEIWRVALSTAVVLADSSSVKKKINISSVMALENFARQAPAVRRIVFEMDKACAYACMQ